MLRGVNKRVVEITDTQSEYFERIYFVVRENACARDMKKLEREALKYTQRQTGGIPPLQKELEHPSTVTVRVGGRVKRILMRVLKYAAIASAGGAALFAVQMLFF